MDRLEFVFFPASPSANQPQQLISQPAGISEIDPVELKIDASKSETKIRSIEYIIMIMTIIFIACSFDVA